MLQFRNRAYVQIHRLHPPISFNRLKKSFNCRNLIKNAGTPVLELRIVLFDRTISKLCKLIKLQYTEIRWQPTFMDGWGGGMTEREREPNLTEV